MLVGDLDGFKQVNDRFGHHVGDRALARVSEVLMRRKRRIDTVARLGGEEFALLVAGRRTTATPTCWPSACGPRSRRSSRMRPCPLTISFGVASFPAHGDSYESLLGAADDALYAAKELGRDRTVIFSREVPGILAPANGRERAAQRAARDGARRSPRRSTCATSAHRAPLATVGRYAALIARELGLPADAGRARAARRACCTTSARSRSRT